MEKKRKKKILASNDWQEKERERWKTKKIKEKKKKNSILTPNNREKKGERWKTKEKQKFDSYT